MKKTIILLAIIVSLLFIPLVASEVVVFDSYQTDATLKDGKLFITKELRLKNVGTTPIIPGEVHFKISQEGKKGASAPQITNFNVVNKYGKALETRKVTTNNEVDLVFTVWDPLLPQFFYEMTMTYELEFKPRGILFYHLILPDERTTIPIKSSETTFNLPKRFHVTYFSPDGEVDSAQDVNTVTWDVKDSYYVEYSIIPFPRMGFKAVNVFWVLIIILFLVNLFSRMRKKARMA